MLSEFDALEEVQQTPEKLAEIVNANSDFPITRLKQPTYCRKSQTRTTEKTTST